MAGRSGGSYFVERVHLLAHEPAVDARADVAVVAPGEDAADVGSNRSDADDGDANGNHSLGYVRRRCENGNG